MPARKTMPAAAELPREDKKRTAAGREPKSAPPAPRAHAGKPAAPVSPAGAGKKALEAPTRDATGPSEKGKAAPKARVKLVRDSFTMPDSDFALIAALKATAIDARRAAKKSELLRAGLHALAALDAQALVAALDRLEAVKTGRPKKGH